MNQILENKNKTCFPLENQSILEHFLQQNIEFSLLIGKFILSADIKGKYEFHGNLMLCINGKQQNLYQNFKIRFSIYFKQNEIQNRVIACGLMFY